MFLRILYQSFIRQRRRKLLAGLAIILGVTLATAMIAVSCSGLPCAVPAARGMVSLPAPQRLASTYAAKIAKSE